MIHDDLSDDEFERQSDEFAMSMFGVVEESACAQAGLLKAAALLISTTAIEQATASCPSSMLAGVMLEELTNNINQLIAERLTGACPN